MNEIIEKMINRHAIRRYQKRQLDEDTLEQILQTALYAPSSGNKQRTCIVVCQNAEINEKLGQLSRQAEFKKEEPQKNAAPISVDQPSIKDDLSLKSSFYQAPTVITIFAPKLKYAYENTSMVAENIQLAAHFLGVGSCYVGRTDEVFDTEYGRKIQKDWGVPEEYSAIGNVILGYREGPEPHLKPRREGRILRV